MNLDEWLGISGRNALVTGGSSGIGLAIVRALLAAGAQVEMIDRDSGVEDVATQLRGEFGPDARLRAHRADVRDHQAMGDIRQMLEDAGTALDILVPNAGMNVRKPLVELTAGDVDAIVSTNVTGVINTIQVFGPMLFGREGASIVATSSACAEHGMVLRTVYCATKAAISGFVRSVALEWGAFGVRVNAVGPGVIETPLTQAYMRQFPEREAAARSQVPLGRVGMPQEVADMVVVLAGRPSRFMTGQTIFMDGGMTAGTSWW